MIFIREVPLCRCPVLQALYSVQPLVESDDSPALTLSRVPAMNIVVILTEMLLHTGYGFSDPKNTIQPFVRCGYCAAHTQTVGMPAP